MRSNIPSFRLPQAVIDEEIGLILDMGVDLRLASPVTGMRDLLCRDDVPRFVGERAVQAHNMRLPEQFAQCFDSNCRSAPNINISSRPDFNVTSNVPSLSVP